MVIAIALWWHLPLIFYHVDSYRSIIATVASIDGDIMKTRLFILAITVLPGAAYAQSEFGISQFTLGTEGRLPITTYAFQHLRSGAEIWFIDAYGKKHLYEVVTPQYRFKGKNGSASLGGYLRFDDAGIVRIGVTGVVTAGQKTGWQFTSPYYLFESLATRDKGVWLPNARLNYPIGRGFRVGVGTGLTAMENQEPNLVLGPHLSWGNHQWTLQVRVATYLSPTTQAGNLQLFTGIGFRW